MFYKQLINCNKIEITILGKNYCNYELQWLFSS